MKITYTAYTAVAEWKWDLPEEADDTCGICRVQFEGTCAKCKYPGQECPISKNSLYPFSRAVLIGASSSHWSMHALLSHALHQRMDAVGGESAEVSHVPPAVQGESCGCGCVAEC